MRGQGECEQKMDLHPKGRRRTDLFSERPQFIRWVSISVQTLQRLNRNRSANVYRLFSGCLHLLGNLLHLHTCNDGLLFWEGNKLLPISSNCSRLITIKSSNIHLCSS